MTDGHEDSPLRRGMWLKQRRCDAGVSAKILCAATGEIYPQQLYNLETHDLVLPLRWAPVLASLGLISSIQEMGIRAAPCGEALKDWRQRVPMNRWALSRRVGIPTRVLALVEAKDFPVPPEWVEPLRDLGFDGSYAPPRYRKNEASSARRAEAVRVLREGGSVDDAMKATEACRASVHLWAMAAGLVVSKGMLWKHRYPSVDAEPAPAAPVKTSQMVLKVPVTPEQAADLVLLAQVFPERAAGGLVQALIVKFLGEQKTTVAGLRQIHDLGQGDPSRFDDPAELLREDA